MPYIDQFGNYYDGDRQYSIVDGVVVWDIETTSPKPKYNSIPIIENGVHIGWQDPTKTLEEQIAEIEVKYHPKFQACKERLLSIILSDDLTQDSKTIEAQDEYKSISDQMDMEIIELMGGYRNG